MAEAAPRPEKEEAAEANAAPGLRARLSGWFQISRKTLLSWAIALLLLLPPAGGILVAYRRAHPPGGVRPTPAMALEALDGGEIDLAEELARKARSRGKPAQPGLRAFVLGAVADHRAEKALGSERRGHALAAAGYLREARKLGLSKPLDDRAKRLQAQNLFRAELYDDCAPLLLETLQQQPAHARSLRPMLAAALRLSKTPKLEMALRVNDEQLADEALTDDERDAAYLDRALITFALSKLDETKETLARLSPRMRLDDEAVLLEARLLMAEAEALSPGETRAEGAAAEKFAAAIDLLRRLAESGDKDDPASGDAAYLTAMCELRLGLAQPALERLLRTAEVYADSHAGFAAGILAAEWLIRRDQDTDAIAVLRRSLATVKSPETYANKWTPLEDLRRQLLEKHQHLMAKQSFEHAAALAGAAATTLPAWRAWELEAQARTAWGRALLDKAASLSPTEASKATREAWREFRRAGDAHLRIAHARRLTPHYANDLWQAATSYRRGEAHRETAATLQAYLSAEVSQLRPTALTWMGEAHLAMNDTDAALSYLMECVKDHPRAAATSSARLVAARALGEKGDLEAAEKLLLDNLYGDVLSPSSIEWRDSLYALGRLRRQANNHAAAIAVLEEAAARYAPALEAVESRYLAAESCRVLGLAESTDDSASAAKRAKWFERGLANYDDALRMLAQEEHTVSTPHNQKLMIRNCKVGRAAMLYELARYEEAIGASYELIAEYSGSPVSLAGYLQLASSYERLGKHSDSASALLRARTALGHINASDEDFRRLTAYTRADWERILTEMIDGAAPAGESLAMARTPLQVR